LRKLNQRLKPDHIPPQKKAELLAVLTKLKPAIAEIAQTNEEEAERISRFVEGFRARSRQQEKTTGRS
jgi:hypothetical protein